VPTTMELRLQLESAPGSEPKPPLVVKGDGVPDGCRGPIRVFWRPGEERSAGGQRSCRGEKVCNKAAPHGHVSKVRHLGNGRGVGKTRTPTFRFRIPMSIRPDEDARCGKLLRTGRSILRGGEIVNLRPPNNDRHYATNTLILLDLLAQTRRPPGARLALQPPQHGMARRILLSRDYGSR